jgi:cysteine-rich repeat protein
MTKKKKLTLHLAFAVFAAGVAQAGGLPVFKCGSGKQGAVSKDEGALLGCFAKYVLKPDNPDPTMSATLTACNTKANGALDAAFTKLAPLPACPGDPTEVHSEVDHCVQVVVDTMGPIPTGQEKCAAAKLKAAGKGAASEVKCLSKEAGKGGLCATPSNVSNGIVAPCPATPCLTGETCVGGLCVTACSPTCPTGTACVGGLCLSKTACGTDQDCTSVGGNCIAIPPAMECSVSLAPCTQDADCGSTGGTCVDACVKKATDKTKAALDKANLAAPCVGADVAIQASIDINCVKTIAGGLPGKAANVCGNGVIESGETCDDGNTLDGDSCPGKTCNIAACTVDTTRHQGVSLQLTTPGSLTVGALTVYVDYPEGQVRMPVTTDPGTVTDGPLHDLSYAFKDPVLDVTFTDGLPANGAGPMLQVTFDGCQGTALPVAGDYKCTILDAADELGTIIDPSTPGFFCTVTIP